MGLEKNTSRLIVIYLMLIGFYKGLQSALLLFTPRRMVYKLNALLMVTLHLSLDFQCI